MNDLISRQDAIDIVEKWFQKIGLNGDICLDGLRSLPSAQPTADVSPVVHGEWISWYVEVKHGNCEEYIPHTACCACGTEIDPYHKDAYKWCPFCGARMDGGK